MDLIPCDGCTTSKFPSISLKLAHNFLLPQQCTAMTIAR